MYVTLIPGFSYHIYSSLQFLGSEGIKFEKSLCGTKVSDAQHFTLELLFSELTLMSVKMEVGQANRNCNSFSSLQFLVSALLYIHGCFS